MATNPTTHLLEEEFHYLRTMDWLNAGVAFVSPTLDITIYNALAGQLLSTFVEVGQQVSLKECVSADREEYTLLADLVRSTKEYRDFVVTWELTGTIRHLLIDSFHKHDEQGHLLGVYIVMKDLGNLSSLEQNVQRIDKLATVGKIAAGVAHEIRNPLTTIKGFLQMMENCFETKEMGVELHYAKVMLKEIERVNSLVSELLLLSKPHDVKKVTCSIADIIRELNPVIAAQSLLQSVDYRWSMEEPVVPLLEADPQLLKQLLLNLTKNALEAMEKGGSLTITLRLVNNWARIDISDTGPGIPYYHYDKIFDAFFTTKDKGTGLGLPICQRIVSDHGGEIRVSSKGFGSTFSVRLPIVS